MNDEREILNLLYRYCELQDAADFAGVAELFRHSGYRVQDGDEHYGYDEVYASRPSTTRSTTTARCGRSTSRTTPSSNSTTTVPSPARGRCSPCTRPHPRCRCSA